MNCGGSTHRPTVCLYETLGVDKTANATDIKNAYRAQALRLHPDRNTGQEEESKLLFQEVSHAYSVLSDPAERRWYDEHMDEILHGGIGGDGRVVNLYQYRAVNAFQGFGDDAASFYSVYDRAFREVFDAEAKKHHNNIEPPSFGSKDTPFIEVFRFYNWWSNFSSKLSFAWEDDYNYNDAPNRRVRRAMEKENSRARNDARKAYDSEIQSLLAFVKRRDKRVILEKVRRENERKIAAEHKCAESVASAERLKINKALWMEEKMAADAQEELEWKTGEGLPIRLADIDMVGDDGKAGTTQERTIYCCSICRKDFKSEKQHEQHCKSKIHKKKLAQFEAHLASEAVNEEVDVVDEEEAAQFDEEDDYEDTTATDNNDKLFVSEEKSVELELEKIGLGSSPFSDIREEEEKVELVEVDSNGNGSLTMTSPTLEKEERGATAADATSFTSRSSSEFASDSEDEFFLMALANKKGGGRRTSFSSSSSSECNETLEEEGIKQQKIQEQQSNSTQNDVGTKDEGEDVTVAKVTLEEGRRRKNKGRNRQQLSSGRVKNAHGGCGSSVTCRVCGEHFPSRSKLFVHLKSSGHAVVKT